MKEISVYIAGPLYSSGDLVTNTRRAIDAAHELEQTQITGIVYRPFVPHLLVPTWQLVHPRGHVEAQEWDDYWLRKCDALLRIPGVSAGSDHEVALAQSLHIPVFQQIAHVHVWAKLVLLRDELRLTRDNPATTCPITGGCGQCLSGMPCTYTAR